MRRRPLVIPVFLPHRGCPHRCVFCNQRAVTGQTDAFPSAKALHAHIDTWLGYRRPERSPVEVSFYGGNFLGLDPGRAAVLLAAAAGRAGAGGVDSLRFSTRPDSVTPRSLAAIAPFPVSTVELGAQSMDDAVLRRSRRGHRAADTVRAVDRLRTAGYRVGLQMMVGLPGDSPDGALASARRLAALRPDFVRIYPTLVLRDSPLAEWYRRGRYRPQTLAEAVRLVGCLHRLFTAAAIPVVRMGLAADPELAAGRGRMAGPYHPAFGHLVLSELCHDQAVRRLSAAGSPGGRVELRVHPRSLSRLQGPHRSNLHRLRRRFKIAELHVRTDESLAAGEVVVGKNG